jgi:hypothetical protein
LVVRQRSETVDRLNDRLAMEKMQLDDFDAQLIAFTFDVRLLSGLVRGCRPASGGWFVPKADINPSGQRAGIIDGCG